MSDPTIAVLGCGSRGRTYAAAAQRVGGLAVVACADTDPRRRASFPGERLTRFASDAELFAAGRVADVLAVCTQDAQHWEHARRALELGYDLLLEKPIADDPARCLDLVDLAGRLGRRVVVCHVLRHTPFYRAIRAIVDRGELGAVATVEAVEGVDAWHQAHSYVRGHWARSRASTPMIVAKCCHDVDLVSWFAGSRCERVASFGSLRHFRAEHAPPGAPARCTDGCPHAGVCPYDAHRYLREHRGWMFVHPDGAPPSDAEALAWLRTSPWGRCAWRCDNDVVDRQTASFEFAGGAVASLTMTAFAAGRRIAIGGTEARLEAGEHLREEFGCDIVVRPHRSGRAVARIRVEHGQGHGGGDDGVVQHLRTALARDPAAVQADFAQAAASTVLAFAAEEARRGGRVVEIDAYIAGLRAAAAVA